MTSYETILVERPAERVAVITLNRPQALNALNSQVMAEVTGAAAELDADPGTACIVITGSGRAFAAGADIREMSDLTYQDVVTGDLFAGWDALTRVRTPLIAAVNGFALGGGCELAMMCDLLIASSAARFGQPEITLGVIPGMGGSQRLTRAIGKAKAMDLCLTGRTLTAQEADAAGLVSRVVEHDHLMEVALEAAGTIASFSQATATAVKETVNAAFESSLAEGLRFERQVFRSRFATSDQKEGMAAFLAKRKPVFTDS